MSEYPILDNQSTQRPRFQHTVSDSRLDVSPAIETDVPSPFATQELQPQYGMSPVPLEDASNIFSVSPTYLGLNAEFLEQMPSMSQSQTQAGDCWQNNNFSVDSGLYNMERTFSSSEGSGIKTKDASLTLGVNGLRNVDITHPMSRCHSESTISNVRSPPVDPNLFNYHNEPTLGFQMANPLSGLFMNMDQLQCNPYLYPNSFSLETSHQPNSFVEPMSTDYLVTNAIQLPRTSVSHHKSQVQSMQPIEEPAQSPASSSANQESQTNRLSAPESVVKDETVKSQGIKATKPFSTPPERLDGVKKPARSSETNNIPGSSAFWADTPNRAQDTKTQPDRPPINVLDLRQGSKQLGLLDETDIKEQTSPFSTFNVTPTSTSSGSEALAVPDTQGHSRRKSDPVAFNRRRSTMSTPMTKSLSTSSRPRKASGNSSATRASNAEDARLSALSPLPHYTLMTPSPRGRRLGPMEEGKKEAARWTRQHRTMCISCKLSKVACKFTSLDSCDKCQKLASDARLPRVCTKAYFLDIVQAGTTNYISQFHINHIMTDMVHRKSLFVEQILDFRQLVPNLEIIDQEFDIRVSHGDKSLFILDSSVCLKYINALHNGVRQARHASLGFIDTELIRLIRPKDWMACIKEDANRPQCLLELLLKWNDTPSRVTFSAIPKKSGEIERVLDPESVEDCQHIYTSAILLRIMNRKLEYAAYSDLQTRLNSKEHVSPDLVINLGRLLLSLRWRLSWWIMFGPGPADFPGTPASREKDIFVERVQSLCRILYFYYCFMKRRLPAYTTPGRLDREQTMYPGSQMPVWQVFPHKETIEGFEAWMKDGMRIIQEAQVAEQLRLVLTHQNFM